MKPSATALFWHSSVGALLLNPRLAPEDKRRFETAWIREQGRRAGQGQLHKNGLVAVTTSGSRGALKLVMISRDALLAAAKGVNDHLQSTADDIWLKTLPEFHVGGLSIFARAFLSGAKVASLPTSETGGWNVIPFHRLLLESSATLVSLVPTQVFDLVRAKLKSPDHLRAIVVGGGALSAELYCEARALGWPVLPSYGLTECGSQVATASLESLRMPLASGAQALPAMQVLPHIEVALDESGCLKIRSEALLDGYVFIEGDATRFEDPKEDGWFTTEDRAELGPNGREIGAISRAGDFIKIGGESVDFSRLERIFEDLLLQMGLRAKLPDCALVYIPDERLGQAIHVIVENEGDGKLPSSVKSDLKTLEEKFNSAVAPFEKIRGVSPVTRIPRSPLGKLLRLDVVSLIAR